MFLTIITDCQDANATGRQLTRGNLLFGFPSTLIGVKSDLEAAGNLIDILEVAGGDTGVILVNIAPRHGDAKKWPNGTPFGYFWYGKTLVVSSIDGCTLSLVKKFGLTDNIEVFDIPTVMDFVVDKLSFDPERAEYIKHTQFRSLEFLPLAAKWTFDKIVLPSNKMEISQVATCHNSIWYQDNFGNCKTTLTSSDIDFAVGNKLQLENIFANLKGEVKCFCRLKDVPNGQIALIVGSSGLLHHKFLELVIQGQSAGEFFGLKG